MSTQNMTKRVKLSQIKEDLHNGVTKWKKDDIGFGSLEKKYSLTLQEMVELTAHPKVKAMETRIPTFVIEDDLPVEEVMASPVLESPVLESRIEVAPVLQEEPKPLANLAVEVKRVERVPQQEEEVIVVPFI